MAAMISAFSDRCICFCHFQQSSLAPSLPPDLSRGSTTGKHTQQYLLFLNAEDYRPLELTACFQDIPLSNKALEPAFCVYEDRGSPLSRKGKNALGISLMNAQKSSPASSEAGSVFGLLERATARGVLISKMTSVFCHPQAPSAA